MSLVLKVSDHVIRKALVALAIERTLLDMGTPVFEKVTSRLFRNYHCYLPDCHDHPEYLKNVLIDIYGNAHSTIVESIREKLEEFIHKKSIAEFVNVISERK